MALDEILAHKRVEVAGRKSRVPLEALRARAEPTTRSLAAALRRGRPGFLLEIKFASPSAGVIRAGGDLEPLIASYGRHADAISVLTDERFFGGSLARLASLRDRVTQPLLCKDFILDPYQVVEARVHGADAILLILAAIDDSTWAVAAAEARGLGMEVLTEAHDAAEVRRAVALGAPIIGINNRNLRTLAVDPGTVSRLAPLVPGDRLVIAESGIASREQVAGLAPVADAMLVGSALMKEPDLDAAVRALVYGRTKICGLVRPEDAVAAHQAGATHGGLMFAERSPRRVSPDQAAGVVAAAPLAWVGVFADQGPELIARTARELGLRAVQLHGHEGPVEVSAVRARLGSDIAVWKACRVGPEAGSVDSAGADRLLLDGFTPGLLGGGGRSFDWSLLEARADRHEIVLAGGLTPDNAAEAAGLVPWALDVSSGVESAPGEKDPGRIGAFLAARRRLPGRGEVPA